MSYGMLVVASMVLGESSQPGRHRANASVS